MLITEEELNSLTKSPISLDNTALFYRTQAYGIHEFYLHADTFLKGDDKLSSEALIKLVILVSEGKPNFEKRKLYTWRQICNATYYANVKNDLEIIRYFKSFTDKLISLLDSKNPLEQQLALRLLHGIFYESKGFTSDWFKAKFYTEAPLGKLWVAKLEGKNVVLPHDVK